ncbi:nischarin isoform X1 [Osmerus mordax]|uniref:nischarin isoform X1 n=1 Tax=Osmerus mordax TaxID=8014 RepID=UPI00350EC797
MESVTFEDVERKVFIVGSELVENYTVYIIEVIDRDHKWTVKHRYSDFYDLHEKLTAEKKVDKHLLPPKKMIGKNSKSLVEKRQKELEVYLQTVLLRFPIAAPKVLSCFLHFHQYEINGITAALAEDLFHKGEHLLVAGEVFTLQPLQLYAITQQLRLAKPTCSNGDAKADLGHILDFTCRLKYLKITGTRGEVGSSNIKEHSLTFDLSIFKALVQIEISECSSKQINGLPSLKSTLATMSIHHSAETMMDILVPEALEFPQWEADEVETDCPVTAVIPAWKTLTTLDMSHNQISRIDDSVKLIPKVEFLDLSYNSLSLVENLQHLYNLIHLDLSYNKLTVLEGVHTKLGNIKTLNLAGNQLDSLLGLSKLYSLVNLDLSGNKLGQLEEIRNIGALPCLEKLSLTNNPMCIIPDYRTKVLAQFWDRASEVCLDCTAPTEKELDTVEVLKAIQKAKEAKDRMANTEKKTGEEARLSGSGALPPSSSSHSAAPCSPSLAQPASSSQAMKCKEEAFVTQKILTPVDHALNQRCFNVTNLSCEDKLQLMSQQSCEISSNQQNRFGSSSCCCCAEDRNLAETFDITPVLPLHLQSYTTSNQDYMTQLCCRIATALWERKKERRGSKQRGEALPGGEGTELSSPSSGDGYFEMGLGEVEEGSGCSGSSLGAPPEDELQDGATEVVHITQGTWCHCVRVGEVVEQCSVCVVLTDRLLVVLQAPTKDPPQDLKLFTDSLVTDCLVPYSDIEAAQFDIPDTCLSLRVKMRDTQWHFFSDAQSLKEIYSDICTFTPHPSEVHNGPATPSRFLRQLLNSWELDDSDYIHGGYAAHLLDPETMAPGLQSIQDRSSENPLQADILSHLAPAQVGKEPRSVPCVLFLTPRHLCVLKVDFAARKGGLEGPGAVQRSSDSKLTRVPLASVLLNPRLKPQQGCSVGCSHRGHRYRDSHVLELLVGPRGVAAVFPLAHDKLLFQTQLGQLRSALRDVKTVAILQTRPGLRSSGRHSASTPTKASQRVSLNSVPEGVQRPHLTLSLVYPNDPLIQKLSEENQCPSHLTLSPALTLFSGLQGHELLEFFHNNIGEVENEELKHISWLSVVFYKSPDVEVTSCVMLSTKALYFLLDDSAAALSDQLSVWDWSQCDQRHPDLIMSYCLAMKLSDMQSVNVGLFDQYFRVVGSSADHILCCLTRDSYGTHHFLQQLMTVLSLLEKAPSPEPSEQDFYTQFGNKSTGKMQNYELVHSSRVKFIYPSEEEIGDLTFIVAERKSPAGALCSFNILLYVLVFQVQTTGTGPASPLPPGSPPNQQPLLQPKTLILTSTDVFLLDEDYISYPLPDFAKEPPSRDKYQLTDARRIRDLDRVLMGYQTYPQALTLVFDDVPGPDLLCHLTMDHFGGEELGERGGAVCGAESEVQWCIYVPGADSRERLICLLARQWEALCSRELPVELTG